MKTFILQYTLSDAIKIHFLLMQDRTIQVLEKHCQDKVERSVYFNYDVNLNWVSKKSDICIYILLSWSLFTLKTTMILKKIRFNIY